jgi:hypothetical protein
LDLKHPLTPKNQTGPCGRLPIENPNQGHTAGPKLFLVREYGHGHMCMITAITHSLSPRPTPSWPRHGSVAHCAFGACASWGQYRRGSLARPQSWSESKHHGVASRNCICVWALVRARCYRTRRRARPNLGWGLGEYYDGRRGLRLDGWDAHAMGSSL